MTDKIAVKKNVTINSVLFVCTFNSIRSPMAECLTKKLCGNKVFIDSVGIAGRLSKINPFVVSVMEEAGLDLSNHQPKHFDDMNVSSFDLIVCLSEEAHEAIKEKTAAYAVDVEYWPTIDPTYMKGNRENIMSAFRSVRDKLERKLEKRLSEFKASFN